MRGKRLAACVLAGLLIFATESVNVLARHAAEERGMQKRMERIERRLEAEASLAARAKAEEQRAERERADAEALAAKAAEEEAVRRDAAAEAELAAKAQAEAEASEARAAAERERVEAEQKAAEQRMAEQKAAEQRAAEKAEPEVRKDTAEAAFGADRDKARPPETPAEQENILGKYLHKKDDTSKSGDSGKRREDNKMVTYIAEADMRLHKLEVETLDIGGTLLFSDSPEYVKEPGIMYSDVVKGDARILYYHLNDMPMTCKVAVILENTSDQYAVVHITRSGLSAPSNDYLKVGRETQRQYFSEQQAQESFYIGAHETRVMRASMDKTLVMPGELVYGLFDFSATMPVRATVIVYPSTANPLDFVRHAPIIKKDAHRLRGTFTEMDRIMKVSGKYSPGRDGAAYVTIGNTVDDAFRAGIDATDGNLVENTGNYGVLYHLEVPMRGRKRVKVWVNPMGGVYTGAVRVNTEHPAGSWMCMVPKDAPFFGHLENAPVPLPRKDGMLDIVKGTELVCLGEFSGEVLRIEFSPPGASNLPVRFLLTEP